MQSEARRPCPPHSPSRCPTSHLVYGTPVHPFVGVFSMLLGVEVYHGERCVELLRSGVVKGALFRVPSCALEEQPSDVCAILRSVRFNIVLSRG